MSRLLRSEFASQTKIDLSPMIDCVFILLIFFIVTTVFVEEIGIPVNQPTITGQQPISTNDNSIMLNISANGVVKYHNRTLGVDEVQGLVRQVMMENSDLSVMILAEKGVKHQIFAEVYGNVKATGAKEISFK